MYAPSAAKRPKKWSTGEWRINNKRVNSDCPGSAGMTPHTSLLFTIISLLKIFKFPLTSRGICCIILRREFSRIAMKQEIAEKSGNFCGVGPFIGRLRELFAAYIVGKRF